MKNDEREGSELELEERGEPAITESDGDAGDAAADPYASLQNIFGDDDFSDIYTSKSSEPIQTPCSFLTGVAGSGKSYSILQKINEDPSYAILSASTGIASVNLNATTIHSTLGFFDLDSLRDAYLRGSAARKLREIVDDGYKNLVIDEISMVSHQMLDLIVQIFDQVNLSLKDSQHPIGLIATGDFAQLPAIPEKVVGAKSRQPTPWAFEGREWPRFEENTTKLTKIWRQSDPVFLSALNEARRGNGHECVKYLAAAGTQFHTFVDMEFDGTTILAENKHVDTFNAEALKRVVGRNMFLPTRRWGKERSEWKNIPHPENHVKENAYVVLLANKPVGNGKFEYVNGDGGHVRGITDRGKGIPPYVNVELVRTGEIVKVAPIIRSVSFKDKPDGFGSDKIDEAGGYYPKSHYNSRDRRYVAGQIQYYPIRLYYASTVHRSQGLTLDRVQVDMRAWQFTGPAMGYISMSRCRTLEGLRIVGQTERVAAACRADPKVARWL